MHLHPKIISRLKKKGWESHYINKTICLLKKSEEKKHPSTRFLDKNMHWIALILSVLGSIILLIGILPIILGIQAELAILIVSMIGLVFGAQINNLIKDTELCTHHYIIAGVMLPGIATITILSGIAFAKSLLKENGIFVKSEPLIIILFYIIAFALPHLIHKLSEKNEFSS